MTTVTVDTYPEQESYFETLTEALKALREQRARSLYTLAYRSGRNRYSIGRPTYWLDTGIAHTDKYLGAAMDSLSMARGYDRVEDDRAYWRNLAKRLICRAGKTERLIDSEIQDHYRNSTRYNQIFKD